jgi:FKBP-type peptidyl-prolyl cis-trans isomerase FklB
MRFLIPFIMVAFVLTACDQQNKAADEPQDEKLPKPEKFSDKVSYVIGYQIGTGLARDSIEVSESYFLQGMKDAMSDDTTSGLLTPEEFQETMSKHQQNVVDKRKKQQEQEKQKMEQLGKKNKGASKEFLAENKNKPGVVTTESGLQYKVLEKGSGQTPTTNDYVEIHLIGKFFDGEVFDNTYKKDRGPQKLPVKGFIPGFEEAVTKMKVGGKWRLFVPADLAFGEKGAPPTIPPNTALILDIELLDIVTEEVRKQQMEQMRRQQQQQQQQRPQGGR